VIQIAFNDAFDIMMLDGNPVTGRALRKDGNCPGTDIHRNLRIYPTDVNIHVNAY
jgi:hypothetical protein